MLKSQRDRPNFDNGLGESDNYKTVHRLERNGRNWIPLSQTSTQACVNLEILLRTTGNATKAEIDIWNGMHCSDILREVYGEW